MATQLQKDVVLFGFYRSSCSARLRISLAIKSISHSSVFVNLADGSHLKNGYPQTNPSQTVPTLQINGHLFTQSIAALEFLEEAFPDTTPLLPALPDVYGRAQVRIMVNIIACDIQPPTNMKILKSVSALGQDRAQWARDLMAAGLGAYEAIASRTAGKYSYGDMVTLADVCLAPAIWNAERFGVDMSPFPTTMEIYKHLSQLPAVKTSHWTAQPDCPAELKAEAA